MTARQIHQWQQLTGQSQHTLRYLRLTLDLNNRSIARSRTIHERGIKWANRFFNYPVTQLLDLRPRGPVTSQPPFEGEPPPNLLIGYFYVARVLNQYLFDQRTYSNISYKLYLSPISFERRMTWQILTDCSYSINTGSYMRAIQNVENFSQTISQIQNAVLMDRILGSLQLADMQGFGSAISAQNQNRSFQQHYQPFSQAFMVLNLQERDTYLIKLICKIKKALCKFLILSNMHNSECILDLPFSEFWIELFIDEFSQLEIPEAENRINLKDLATVLTLGKGGMHGGALTLRSGTRVGLPFRLRPRENYRAITEIMRRSRGDVIRRFIDRLPVNRRQRVRNVEETSSSPLTVPEIEDEGFSDREPSSSDLSREEFNDEVIASIVDLIQNLEEELTPEARRSNFFNYGSEFFQLLIRFYNENRLTDDFIQKWLVYFFILEHVASTLYYLYLNLVQNRLAARNIGIQFVQIILRGRNENGEDIFTRVWFNRETQAFRQLYSRITRDFLGIIEANERSYSFSTPEERDQLLQDIDFVEDSGSIEEVINQVNTDFSDLDSVEIAFRIKLSGIVGYSTNEVVLRSFERVREAALNRWLQRQ
ncbi:pTP [Ovine adenovirus 7]|uniref:PTP n=1 Tax=Ovine adenovirus D serotype 7 (isolate OAV287) TaxID=114430 RepID=Q83896_ADEO7|nr:pTP [Ovine adenovirus 7]AAD45952.1 pTP [Ovine adenovirus 7]